MAAEADARVVTIAPTSEKLPYHENFELHRCRLVEVGGLLASSACVSAWIPGDQFLPNGQRCSSSTISRPCRCWSRWWARRMWASSERLGPVCVRRFDRESARPVGPADRGRGAGRALPADRPLAGLGGIATVAGRPRERLTWPRFWALLSEKRYQGPITLMPNRKTLDTSRRDAAVRAAADGLNRLWKTAVLTADEKAVATATAH